MKTAVPLRIAAVLVLFTCAGHTFGTFAPVPPDQTAVAIAVETMRSTLVPMPFGRPQSYEALFLGTNLCVSVFLLVTGLVFFALAKDPAAGAGKAVLLITSVGMAVAAVLCAIFFFPLPAICTGVAALIGLSVAAKA